MASNESLKTGNKSLCRLSERRIKIILIKVSPLMPIRTILRYLSFFANLKCKKQSIGFSLDVLRGSIDQNFVIQ